MSTGVNKSTAGRAWLWALLPLLLAAALVTKQLDNRAFFGDEPDSLYSAGINNAGPRTLAEVWEFIAETHPTQTQGWSKLLFIWGRIVGWSEPAIRSLSFSSAVCWRSRGSTAPAAISSAHRRAWLPP